MLISSKLIELCELRGAIFARPFQLGACDAGLPLEHPAHFVGQAIRDQLINCKPSFLPVTHGLTDTSTRTTLCGAKNLDDIIPFDGFSVLPKVVSPCRVKALMSQRDVHF